ncbi:MAG: UDP-4-amino-4,6-dideoxy-N-acetyl-beta-L-altrosamine transaminase [Kordiimonadaceae bacterium]|nr:UDP-4-amino-4,6-dideoxy-N-acetyl-beta-L-altrosamine transaminase [Kordiimonadaceae bacterium]
MSDDFLPYGRHSLDEDDIAAVVEVLRHGALTCGPQVEKLEKAFAASIGCKHAIVTSNGTTALHLAVLAAGIGPGDTVVVPTVTFLSTANVVHMAGGTVQFADVCPETGVLTAEAFASALTKCTGPVKAVMPVHLTGQACDMAGISKIAAANNISIISDCCHALGADYHGGGAPGDGQHEIMGCFSLHPVKSIAMGEGGVVTTNDAALAETLYRLRSHDMHKDPAQFARHDLAFDAEGQANPWYYEMQELGYNYRATDFQCALANSQLKKLPVFVERRRYLAGVYDQLLTGHSNLLRPNVRLPDSLSAWHLYAVQIDFKALGKSRAGVMKALAEKGIGTQVHYIPVHEQPYYQKAYGKQNLPGADKYYQETLSLPLFPAMDDSDPARVVRLLTEILSAT